MTLILVEVWLIQAKEMPLNSFVILRRKGLQHRCCLVEFVKILEQWWLFLKTCKIIT